jgi:transposase
LTTKVHLACDGQGRPLSVVLTPGQRHDSTQLEPVLDAIRVPRPGGRGRPRKRPDHLIGDKGYSYDRCRQTLRRRGIPHTIPERADQRASRAANPSSARRSTGGATSSNGASTGSSSGVGSPLATTSGA